MTGIRDLARHLNISIGTVSRALNNKPDISEATKTKVLSAAQELGYVPNQAGRSLRKGNTNVVGFVMHLGNEGMIYGDLFFIRVFDGMQSVLSQHGLNLVALLSPNSEDPDAYLRQIVAQKFTDALVLSSIRREDSRISYLAEQNLPFATLGRSLIDGGQPWLDLDFDGMVSDAMERLASKGHRVIAIAPPFADLNLHHLMIESYKRNTEQLGMKFDERFIVEVDSGEDGAAQLLKRLVQMEQKPTAIIYADHILPFGLYRGLAQLGMTPGKDLSIVGVGTRLASSLSPNLTHYRFNLFDLGVKIAQALLPTMKGRPFADAEMITRENVPFTLVDGDSIQDIR